MLLMSFGANAEDYCKRRPVDPEVPAGFGGDYEVIGRDSDSGKPCMGTLIVRVEKSVFALERTVDGGVDTGEAWFAKCGVDDIDFLIGSYATASGTLNIMCRTGADGDSYYRVTCRTG